LKLEPPITQVSLIYHLFYYLGRRSPPIITKKLKTKSLKNRRRGRKKGIKRCGANYEIKITKQEKERSVEEDKNSRVYEDS